MKKLTQLHVDVSAYFFALTLTAIICFFLSAMYYVELCAKDTLPDSGGLLCGFIDGIVQLIDGYAN